MNTEKLLKAIRLVNESVESNSEAVLVIDSLAKVNSDLEGHLQILALPADASIAWNNANKIHSKVIADVQDAIRLSPFSKTHDALRQLQFALSSLSIDVFESAKSSIDNFSTALDLHLHSHDLNTSIGLSRVARKLNSELDKIAALYLTLKETTAKGLVKQNETVKVFFPDEISLESFAEKISALSLIFDEYSQLNRLSTREAEIEIAKIESGSFFAEISGNPIIIAAVSSIITSGVVHIFSKLDKEKESNTLNENTDTLERILNIRGELKNNNIDTDALDEEIKKSTLRIAKQLGKLIGTSREIEINDKKISLQPESLLAHRPNLIGNLSDADEKAAEA